MSLLIGIDEVGRGCWAGPLVVGAVALNDNIIGLNDSKLLTPLKRHELSQRIYDVSTYCSLGWVWSYEVDELGLTHATTLAIERAIENAPMYSEIIIDGNINYLAHNQAARAVIKADGTIPAVSAASIIAKVARDAYMHEQSQLFPEYGFDRHVGYGTKAHMDALSRLGITELHRKSYKPVQAVIGSDR